jgi:hypothetical protein
LKEVETGQCPELKSIANCSLTYKSYCAQWKSLAVRNGILKHHWESADGRSKIAWIILLRNRVSHVLTELHGGPSGHLGVMKVLSGKGSTGSRKQTMLRSGAGSATPMQPDVASEPGIRAKCISTILAPFERIAINVAGPFPWSNQGNQYLLIAMDYFTKWLEAYTIPNQEASTVTEVLVTNFFCLFRVLRELPSDQGYNFKLSDTEGFATPGSKQVANHVPAIGQHGRELHQNDQGKPMKGHCIAPEGLGCKIALLLVYRASTHGPAGFIPARLVFGTELCLPCNLPFGTPNPPPPQQGTTHSRSRSKFSRPSTQHPQLCPPAP